MKCALLPPKTLYLPVLPARICKKLMFSLCRKCTEDKSKEICTHNDNERIIEGTWVTLEIYKAISKGYTLVRIDEVWHWDQTTNKIFKSYINFAIKGKQEASGWPEGITTAEQKSKYIRSYYNAEGIHLDEAKIEKNPGLRTVMKLIANSFWGFLAKRSNKMQHRFITKPAEWFSMLSDSQYIIHDVDFKHKNILQVYYTKNEEIEKESSNTNVVLASFVTAQGRLKLYSELEKLDKRVLYMDTDSIIFTSKLSEYEPELGNNLGEWTNEIDAKDGGFIKGFFSAGPKNYGYDLPNGKTKCIVKGITQNSLASVRLNHETMKRIITQDQAETVTVPQLKFSRDKYTWAVKTETIDKKYGFIFDKRILFNNFTTLPYGYSL